MSERVREHRSDLPTEQEIASRADDGWELVAIEWQRGSSTATPEGRRRTEIPYGLRPSRDGLFLEDEPDEFDVLRRVLSGLVDDTPLTQIASELNDRGYRTRYGRHWRQRDLFDMLPRIVEAGADILCSETWSRERRERKLELA